MTDAVKKRLFDALRACEPIIAFTSETTFAEYEKDLMRRSAVERQLEIIGEALRQADKADQSVADRIAALPEIVALRNRVIHGYDSVDEEIVWDIVQTNIPTLTHQLRGVLDVTN